MDALCSERLKLRSWTLSRLGHGCSLLRMHSTVDVSSRTRARMLPWLGHACSPLGMRWTMDVIMVRPWMVYSENASTMDVIMVWPWMFSSQNTVDHGCHHGFPWIHSSHHPLLPSSRASFQAPISDTPHCACLNAGPKSGPDPLGPGF